MIFWYTILKKEAKIMRKIIGILLLSLSIITLIACSKNNYQSLDGEYYWISSERNELVFTIKGDSASIEHGEADSFIINKKKNTIELTGQNIASRTEEYSPILPNRCFFVLNRLLQKIFKLILNRIVYILCKLV